MQKPSDRSGFGKSFIKRKKTSKRPKPYTTINNQDNKNHSPSIKSFIFTHLHPDQKHTKTNSQTPQTKRTKEQKSTKSKEQNSKKVICTY
jgi:hypothetical protein